MSNISTISSPPIAKSGSSKSMLDKQLLCRDANEVGPVEIPYDKNNPKMCVMCNKQFQNTFGVKTHYQNVHLKLMHKCTIDGCNSSFPSKRSRDRHSANINLHKKLLSVHVDKNGVSLVSSAVANGFNHQYHHQSNSSPTSSLNGGQLSSTSLNSISPNGLSSSLSSSLKNGQSNSYSAMLGNNGLLNSSNNSSINNSTVTKSNAADLLKSDLLKSNLLNGANTTALFDALNTNSALRDDLLKNRDLLNNFSIFNNLLPSNLASLSMLFQQQLENGIN